MKSFEDLTNMTVDQQNSIMRIRRMKKLFDIAENEIIKFMNSPNCRCFEKVEINDDFSFEQLEKCDGACKNYTLDESIEKVEKNILYKINKEYFENRDFE